MLHLSYHSKYLGCSFYFSSGIHLVQTQCLQRQLLALGAVDGAFYQRDLDLFHDYDFALRQAQRDNPVRLSPSKPVYGFIR